ncbi:hypothetical protein KI387_020486, partial [Taxus chinensis]
ELERSRFSTFTIESPFLLLRDFKFHAPRRRCYRGTHCGSESARHVPVNHMGMRVGLSGPANWGRAHGRQTLGASSVGGSHRYVH